MNQAQRKTIRKRLFADNPFCHWCGKKMKLGAGYNGEMDLFATIEHLAPISQGGNDMPDNITLVHKKCNK